MRHPLRLALLLLLMIALAACTLEEVDSGNGGTSGGGATDGETATVVRVIDGDTIEVRINGVNERVRYVGVNTPERDEPCYQDALDFNASLVENQTVRLVRDTSDRDRFDRLLRYIYVGDTFVNAALIEQGYAEVVLYGSDDREFTNFRNLEILATNENRGCHPTGIFDDNNYER